MLEPSNTGFLAVLIAALTGSVHCAGMCGGFVALYSVEGGKRSILAHAAYNLGRLATYLLLGTIAGKIGNFIDNIATLAGIRNAAAVLVALMLIFWGIKMLLGLKFSRKFAPGLLARMMSPFANVLRKRDALPPVPFAALLGLLSTFLPCGFLYLFVAMAAGTGDALHGALLMACFWLGTVPMLAVFGGTVRFLSARMLAFLPRLTAALILAAGFYSLSWHMNSVRMGVEGAHCHSVGLAENNEQND